MLGTVFAAAEIGNEINVLNELRCTAHIVQLYDSSIKPPYLFFELLEGGGLDDYISEKKKKETKIPELEVVGYVIQILTGLVAAHAKEIMHRDMKPDNIVFADKDKTTLKVLN